MEIVFAICGIAGLVWGGVLLARGGLLAGCLSVLLAGICFGAPFFSVPMSPMPLTADRLLLVVVLAQFGIFYRLGWTEPKPLRTADWVLLALIATLVVSTLTHDWSFRKAQPLAQLVFCYFMPLALYAVARQSRLSKRGVLSMFGCLAAFGVYLALTGIAERLDLRQLVFPRYISDPTYVEFFGRARGPLLNPVGYGILATVSLCATLLCLPRVSRFGKLALLGVALLVLVGIWCTMTRSCWMGAALALAILAAVGVPRSWRAAVLGGGLLVAALVVLTQWQNLNAFKRDKDLSVAAMTESASLRPILATIAWQMFQDRPLLGFGYGQYVLERRPYLSDRSTDLPLEKGRPYIQHNVLLALLTDTGLIGMSLFLALVTLWTRDAWRLWRATAAPLWARQQGILMLCAIGAYLVNGMFHDVSLIPMINMLLFFLAGVTAGLAPLTMTSTSTARLASWRPLNFGRTGWRVAGAANR